MRGPASKRVPCEEGVSRAGRRLPTSQPESLSTPVSVLQVEAFNLSRRQQGETWMAELGARALSGSGHF